MYIMITSRCNMSCAHCCQNCTTEGEDMSLETFRNALKYDGTVISIGGGEPTLHPLFWQMCMEAVGWKWSDSVWLATNGSQTEIAITLANLAKKGVLGVALSQDSYHDPIDPEVIRAFTRDKSHYLTSSRNMEVDSREIRNVEGKEVFAGRCDFGEKNRCVCDGLQVLPDGTVRACGCLDAPTFGNINGGLKVPELWNRWECWKTDDNKDIAKQWRKQHAHGN